MRTCRCPHPSIAKDDPSGRCRRCSSYLRAEVRTTPQTFEEFHQRLAEALFSPATLYGPNAPGPPGWFQRFIDGCRRRYEAGADFGYTEFSYIARNNATEACDEALDGAVYSWFALLHQRQVDGDEEWALALTAARHFAEAHRCLEMLATAAHLTVSDGDPEAPTQDPPE